MRCATNTGGISAHAVDLLALDNLQNSATNLAIPAFPATVSRTVCHDVQYAFFEPEAPEVAFRQLALCGRALPAEEAYSILMAMKRLGGDAELKVEALRFFGKFFGTRSDYYVFECRMVERPEKVCAMLPSLAAVLAEVVGKVQNR